MEHDGAKFSVVIFPNEALDYTNDGDWNNDPHVANLLKFLKREKFNYMNPSPELYKAKSSESGCLSFDCGSHFTEKGHEIFTDILYRYVVHDLLSADTACIKR